ncbi:MAG: NTP transferase domain-containing protein [Acidisphaera sp.]|nr:NTP transferase domain-containing protein [Acidisphaera sp.]
MRLGGSDRGVGVTQVRQALLLTTGLAQADSGDGAPRLAELAGRTLLDHALDRLAAAGVASVTVAADGHAGVVAKHLAARVNGPNATLWPGARSPGTANGWLGAVETLEDTPLFVVDGEAFWLDGPVPALTRLATAWDPGASDATLLVARTFGVHAEVGAGDFAMDPWGVLRRRREREIVPYLYAGVQVTDRRLFAPASATAGMADLWRVALDARRLYGVVHDGLWCPVATPADLDDAEAVLQSQALGWSR